MRHIFTTVLALTLTAAAPASLTCQEEFEQSIAAAQTMPTIPRIVSVVVANETLADCLGTPEAQAARDTILERLPGDHLPWEGDGLIDIEIVALELEGLHDIEIDVWPGAGGPPIPLPWEWTEDGFHFELDPLDLNLFFDDGFIISLLMFDEADSLIGGGAFVVTVPAPGVAAMFVVVGLVTRQRRR